MAPKTEESTDHIFKKPRVTRESLGAVVQVKVGPEKTFVNHKGILCRSAAYFKAALEGEFKESKDEVLELPEDDPVVFSHFELWLYTGNILESHESVEDIGWDILTKIYLFGDARGIPELQNEAIDLYIDKNHAIHEIATNQLNFIYENTLENSPLRKLLVDIMTFRTNLSHPQWFREQVKSDYPKQFLLDLVKSLYEKGAGTKSKVIDFRAVRSNYHVHDSGKESNCRAYRKMHWFTNGKNGS